MGYRGATQPIRQISGGSAGKAGRFTLPLSDRFTKTMLDGQEASWDLALNFTAG
jgi:hypothetical protein